MKEISHGFCWKVVWSSVTICQNQNRKRKNKRWLNAGKTHRSPNWAAFQVTLDELTLFSFPLNCRFLKLTCLYKSDQSEGWEVRACTQGRLPLLTSMWDELATAKKSSAVWKICGWKTDGWTDGGTGGGVSALSAPSCPDRTHGGGNGGWGKVSYISCSWNAARPGWNVQQVNIQTRPALLRDQPVKDWLSVVGEWQASLLASGRRATNWKCT